MMDTLQTLIDRVPPNFNWLLRSDESGRYFCHISHFDCVAYVGQGMTGGLSVKTWGISPDAAFLTCLEQVELRLRGG